MKNIYLWLYERYAVPKLKDLNKAHTEITATFAERVGLSQTNRLRLDDLTGNMRLQWGAEVFALGADSVCAERTAHPTQGLLLANLLPSAAR